MEKFETVSEVPNKDEKAFATIMEKLATEIETKSQKEEVIEAVGKLVSWLDQSTVFQMFRKAWNILPRQAQWLVLKGEAILVPGISFKAFNNLVEIGLLNYKGHKNEEDKGIAIDRMAKDNREIFETAIKIIVPTEKAALPILECLERIDEAKLKMYAEVRNSQARVEDIQHVEEAEVEVVLKEAA